MVTKKDFTRRQVHKRLKIALNKRGYVSLRSIIESRYSYPQQWIIEPIRRVDIDDSFYSHL